MPYFGYQVDLVTLPDQAIIFESLKQQLIDANHPSQLVAAEIVDNKVDLWFSSQNINITIINSAIANHHASLDQAKKAKYAAIDAKTDEIIARGFTFQNIVFSTSLDAQSRMLGMDQLRNDAAMTYPIIFNSLDDSISISIPDADTVHAFVLTGVGYYRAAIDSGSALKADVRAATTVAEVQAITDTRT